MFQSTIHVDDQSRLLVESVPHSMLRVFHVGALCLLLPTWVVSKTHFVVSVDWRLVFILSLDKLCNPFSRCSCHLESWMFGLKSYTLCVCACHNTLPHQRVYYSLCMHGILSDFLREIRSASVCPAPRILVWQLPLCSSMLCRPIIRVACHRLARPHCSHFVCMLIRLVFLSPIRYAV